MPQPFPHRVSVLATTLVSGVTDAPAGLLPAKLIGAVVFDLLVRHPVVSMSDFDDDRLTDDDGRLLDARHPEAEALIDWQFRVNRRADVLWFEVGLDRDVPPRLFARRPVGPIESWTATDRRAALSDQLADVIGQWLAARRLPAIGPAPAFTRAELAATAAELDRVIAAVTDDAAVPEHAAPPRGLAIAFYRVLGDLLPHAGPMWQRVLALDPDHVVARRSAYLATLRGERVDRRAILAIVSAAPMYGKPHMSIWGEAFAADRPVEGMGLHHQGIAATLLPNNPYACHNYSLQLAEKGRREESYRWADRATVAAPAFASAHLDCVRRLRRCGRPGQAFSEAQYRCHEILEHHRQGTLAAHERSLQHHAELLLAFAHLDIGRIDEAIELAESALASVPPELEAEFAWARSRLDQWRSDPLLLANAYAWDGHHAADPGRVVKGLSLGRIADEDDVAMMIDALVALGREELALVAYHHHAGVDGGMALGDGKARLAAARALLLCGDAATALEQIQIVELRRPQARLEAEINRVLRLACCRSAAEWDAVIRKRITAGAERLARMAARDLADFVPGVSRLIISAALGEQSPFVLDDAAIQIAVDAVPEAARWSAAIVERLRRPPDDTLESADRLAQEWWSVLVPPGKDRDGHAASAMLAFGVALARYLELSTQHPTPIAGAYRHIATEALHLVRRSRYQITDRAIRGVLALIERCGDADDWVRDMWLLRLERALDLDHEQGAQLAAVTQGLPSVSSLIRGDERIGWELRFAFDLGADPSQREPASFMFERTVRATEGGAVAAAWSRVIARADDHGAASVDALWLAALAAQHWEPWTNLAAALFGLGRRDDGFDAACRALARATGAERGIAIDRLRPVWPATGLDVPIAPAAAFMAGMGALAAPATLDRAVRCLRWSAVADPTNLDAVRALAAALARAGRVHECVRVLASIDRHDPARAAGNLLLDAGRYADAVLAYRYAAMRFSTSDDWRLLAVAAWHADDSEIAVHAYQKCMAAGGTIDAETLNGYVTSLNAIGRWKEAEAVADRLIDVAGGSGEDTGATGHSHGRSGFAVAGPDPLYRAAGLHALAVALAGQGKFAEAAKYAREAVALNPAAQHTEEMAETLRCIEARQGPPVERGPESGIERTAFDALAAGDPHTPENLARDANSWGLARAAIAAAELRRGDEVGLSVPGRVLEAALRMLDRTPGVLAPDAILCRIRALRIRENAFIQIDPAPPPGQRMTPDELDERHAERVERAAELDRARGPAPRRPRTTRSGENAEPATD
jgi:tetratricopeptide (TPR) repeat protein